MRHPTEGVLRRLIDEPAGVADRDREHVAGCQPCLGMLAAMRADAAVVAAALDAPGGAEVDVDAAWRRLADASGGEGRGGVVAFAGPARFRALLRRPLVAATAVA